MEILLKSSLLVMLGLCLQIGRETLHGGKQEHCPNYQFRGRF